MTDDAKQRADRAHTALTVVDAAFKAAWPAVLAALHGAHQDVGTVTTARDTMFEIEQRLNTIAVELRRLRDDRR